MQITFKNPDYQAKVQERFERRINKTETCWEWLGGKTVQGYGLVNLNGKRVYAHRLSFYFYKGDFPEIQGFHGAVVRHTCNNPSCVNPGHLIAGTQKENMNDKHAAGTQPVGSKTSNAKFTEEQVLEIRSLYKKGNRWHREFAAEKLAELYNTTIFNIYSILHRKTWKHI